jgi:hypothetical protein
MALWSVSHRVLQLRCFQYAQIAANRAEVVVAIKESLDGDNRRPWLCYQICLQCVAFGIVHKGALKRGGQSNR